MAELTAEERAEAAAAIQRLLTLVEQGRLAASGTERAYLSGAAKILHLDRALTAS